MSNLQVCSQTGWQFMLGRDGQMQRGFVHFQNFSQGLVLLVRRLFSKPMSLLKKPPGGISQGL